MPKLGGQQHSPACLPPGGPPSCPMPEVLRGAHSSGSEVCGPTIAIGRVTGREQPASGGGEPGHVGPAAPGTAVRCLPAQGRASAAAPCL